jgi:predicted cobalt transporter CbtA
MTRTATLLAITVLSSIATPFVVNATGTKQPAAAPAPVAASAPAPAPVVTAAVATEEASCTRRVRVVYRGYIEPAGACPGESK